MVQGPGARRAVGTGRNRFETRHRERAGGISNATAFSLTLAGPHRRKIVCGARTARFRLDPSRSTGAAEVTTVQGDDGAARRSEMLMVRAGSPAASRRLSATLLLGRAPIAILVRAAPLGRARVRGRHSVTIADIRNGDPAACTLLLKATLPAPIDDDTARRSPTPVAPCAKSHYSPQQNLERLMVQAIARRRR
jgi:hypothetical protein